MFKTSKKYWIIIVVAIALIAGSVDRSLATPLTISNPGFDDVTLLDGEAIAGIQGWSGSGIYGTRNPLSNVFDVNYGGGNIAYVNSGYIYQDLLALNPVLGHLNAGSLYTLTVDVGHQTSASCGSCTSLGYKIELLSGGNSLADSGWLTGTLGAWNTASLTYSSSTSGTDPLQIRLYTSGKRAHFDNVRLTNDNQNGNHTAVPEPATLVLLGSGLVGVALYSKKKFKA